MKLSRAIGLAALSCALSAPAGATEIVSLDVTHTKFDYDDLGAPNGLRLSFEHRFDEHPFQLGLGYYGSGKADVANFPAQVSFSAFDLLGAFAVAPTPGSPSRFFIGGGVYHGSFQVDAFGVSDSEKTTGLTFAVGFDWLFSEHVGARIGYQTYLKAKDFADKKDIGVLQAGLVVAWGAAQSPPSHPATSAAVEVPPAPAPQPAPVMDAAPTPAPPPPVETAPPPAAAPAAPPPPVASAAPPAPAPAAAPATLIAGGRAKLRDGAFGRNRATADGAAVRGLDAGTIVTLKSTMDNRDGTWWYVTAPGAVGWARAQDLDPQS